jgi:hypothetical protein
MCVIETTCVQKAKKKTIVCKNRCTTYNGGVGRGVGLGVGLGVGFGVGLGVGFGVGL